MDHPYPLPNDIQKRLSQLPEYLHSRPAVVFAYLFGGFGRQRVTPLSDIDIAVFLRSETDLLAEKIELIQGVSALLGTENIDLVILNDASLSLATRAIRDKELLVDKEPYVRHRYESLAVREYLDFQVMEKDILTRRFGSHGR